MDLYIFRGFFMYFVDIPAERAESFSNFLAIKEQGIQKSEKSENIEWKTQINEESLMKSGNCIWLKGKVQWKI